MQKETKMFNVDGINMQFDSEAFNMFFTNIRKKKDLKVLDLELRIGDEVGVSRDAVHSWRFGQNGPVDLDIVKSLAVFLGISDYKMLLKERKVNMTVQVTERQKDSLKKIYDAIIDWLGEFLTAYYYEEREMNDEVGIALEKIIDKEYIILHKLELYSEILKYYDYLTIDLEDKYYGIAFDWDCSENDLKVVEEEHKKALDKINDLLNPYFN